MSRKRLFRGALILAVGAVFTATAFMPPQQASASFDKDYIMSDAVFENAATIPSNDGLEQELSSRALADTSRRIRVPPSAAEARSRSLRPS